jgi:hypothetical protein
MNEYQADILIECLGDRWSVYPQPHYIRPVTVAGRAWLTANLVPGTLDDPGIIEDVVDRAFNRGLEVFIDGRRYIGMGFCSVPRRPDTYRFPSKS